MIMNEPYRVVLSDLFEGPMDLLVHLIKKNELPIYDIPIALITEKYLEYLKWMDALNIDYASEFVVLAATLTQGGDLIFENAGLTCLEMSGPKTARRTP